MKSMTGYGKATVNRDNKELTIELKSVNHRFLDISLKTPRAFIAHEDIIRNGLSKGLARGHIDVFVNFSNNGSSEKTVKVDLELARGYVNCVKQLSEVFPELHNDFNLNALMRSGEVLSLQQVEEDETLIREMLTEAVESAVCNLNAMRETEGNSLRNDLLLKIDNVENLLNKVKIYAPLVSEQYRDKLKARVSDALQGVEIDENKLINEVCFFTDKSCVDEEITRLESHIARARELLGLNEPVGRKLDFLIQEFNRETNTICSKSSYLDLTNVALEMKNEIEKIREQIQNIE